MYFWYSFSVVAPIARSSPRARAGLSMFDASIAPSAAPAPTRVWSSSMKRMIVPCASSISLRTAFSRSSNSPRYLAPAIIAPRSRATTRLFLSPSGTSPMWMRRARPSTIAVLPTPGSPMRTGLFFVRRDRTWITRRISSSRPMTGSILPRRGVPRVRLRESDQQVLGRDVLVAEVLRDLERPVEDPRELARRSGVGGRAGDGRTPREVSLDLARQPVGVHPELLEDRDDDAFALVEEGEQEMVRS